MDSVSSTKDMPAQTKLIQENILLEIIKEVCCDSNPQLSSKLVGNVTRIIADCDLTHYSSLHRLNTANESTATVLGFMNQTTAELTFDEQIELNNAILDKIQSKLPAFNSELEKLQRSMGAKTSRKEEIQMLQKSIDEKLNILKEQESEKVDLMTEWLNHRTQHVTAFVTNLSELSTLKTKILEMKSRILHLQILQKIYTETNQSIKAYSEILKDLMETLQETEQRIKYYRDIIEMDS